MLKYLLSFGLLFLASAVNAQDYTDDERIGFYRQCIANGEQRCCDHLTDSAAEKACACASNCARPIRAKAYSQCIGNPAADANVSSSCCEHLTNSDSELLKVCGKGSGITWAELKPVLEGIIAAGTASGGGGQ